MRPKWDCVTCGVCCCNPEGNLRIGSREYVEVTKKDALYQRDRELLKKLAVRNDDGQWFLKLVGDDQRCVALTGTMQERVACAIYPMRPRGCRVVQVGDDECLRARLRFGLPTE